MVIAIGKMRAVVIGTVVIIWLLFAGDLQL